MPRTSKTGALSRFALSRWCLLSLRCLPPPRTFAPTFLPPSISHPPPCPIHPTTSLVPDLGGCCQEHHQEQGRASGQEGGEEEEPGRRVWRRNRASSQGQGQEEEGAMNWGRGGEEEGVY
eukprot:2512892-Rhodomonas_salina.1